MPTPRSTISASAVASPRSTADSTWTPPGGGWTVIQGGGHPGVVECYVDPEFQVRQLREAGFEPVAIFGRDGRQVELPYGGRDPWLDYLCKPLAEG